MLKNLTILAAMLIPALAGDPVVAADTPRKEPSLPAIYSYRAADIESLRRGFATPPREVGPWVYWFWWNGVLAEEELQRAQTGINADTVRGLEQIGGFSGKAVTLAQGELYAGDPGFFKTRLEWMNEATPEAVFGIHVGIGAEARRGRRQSAIDSSRDD